MELRRDNAALRRELDELEDELHAARRLPLHSKSPSPTGDAYRLQRELEAAERELEWMSNEMRTIEEKAGREVDWLSEEQRRAHARAEDAEAEARRLRLEVARLSDAAGELH